MKDKPVIASSTLPAHTPLQSRRLFLARLAWFALVAMQLVTTAYGYPEYYRKALTLDLGTASLNGPWTQTTLAAALSGLGLAPGSFAAYIVSHDALQFLSFFFIGALIFWRKSNTWLGLFASFVLIGIGSTIGGGSETLARLASPWQELTIFTNSLVWPSFFILLFLFPDGRFVPRWTRLFIPLWGLFYAWFVLSDLVLKLDFDTFKIFGVFFMVLSIGASLFGQVYRYRRVSGPVERQQTLWFLLAIALVLGWSSLQNFLVGPFLDTPGLPVTLALLVDLAWQPVGLLAMSALPLSIAIALFRYRLWDIDVIIRKTLVYTVVMGLLALVYFGAVVLLQGLFTGSGIEQSPVVIVLSTLAIAALFNPLRRRVQAGVDRRFYRSKYDAEKTLAAFAEVARSQVDLQTVTEGLVFAAEESFKPRMVSLWLKTQPGNQAELKES